MKEQEILLDQISKKLSVLIALMLMKDVKNLTTADGVKVLVRFGLSNQEIANILGTTKGTIEVVKSRANKSKK